MARLGYVSCREVVIQLARFPNSNAVRSRGVWLGNVAWGCVWSGMVGLGPMARFVPVVITYCPVL